MSNSMLQVDSAANKSRNNRENSKCSGKRTQCMDWVAVDAVLHESVWRGIARKREKYEKKSENRVVISYALSMIPDWILVLQRAINLLSPNGALYVVDFSDQAELPSWFRQGLFAWLNHFCVTPRLDLCEELSNVTRSADQSCRFRQLYKGYAVLGELHM